MPGVYLSYPFCAQKCTYCNFASGVFPEGLIPRYLARLRQELEAAIWTWKPETVYWGGGTPSLIPPDELAALHVLIPGQPWQEATMEAAPGTITPEKAAVWRKAGIDRVSLGVQSFVESEIRRTGRKHTYETVERDVATLREAGIAKINIDLIAGLAGQTHESWNRSLDALMVLEPDHASVYMLEVDEDSRLGREVLLGGVRYGAGDVPDDGATAEFYEIAVARLREAGLERYEISNFALAGHESAHNLKYWRREPYWGFGVDAHSFDGLERWSNPETVEDYLAGHRCEHTRANPDEERFFLGLRLREGVDAAGAPRTRGEEAGLLERTNGRLRLTDRGVLLSNEVFAEFLQ